MKHHLNLRQATVEKTSRLAGAEDLLVPIVLTMCPEQAVNHVTG